MSHGCPRAPLPLPRSLSAVFFCDSIGVPDRYHGVCKQDCHRPEKAGGPVCQQACGDHAESADDKGDSAEFLAFFPGDIIFPAPFCTEADDRIIFQAGHQGSAEDQKNTQAQKHKTEEIYGNLGQIFYLMKIGIEEIKIHADWVDEWLDYYDITTENIESIIQKEIADCFVQVLECAGVYKRTEKGFAAFKRFLSVL